MKIIDPHDACFCDNRSIDNNKKADGDIIVFLKLDKKTNNSNQGLNQADPTCDNNDDSDVYGPSYVSDDIDNGEFERNDVVADSDYTFRSVSLTNKDTDVASLNGEKILIITLTMQHLYDWLYMLL